MKDRPIAPAERAGAGAAQTWRDGALRGAKARREEVTTTTPVGAGQ